MFGAQELCFAFSSCMVYHLCCSMLIHTGTWVYYGLLFDWMIFDLEYKNLGIESESIIPPERREWIRSTENKRRKS